METESKNGTKGQKHDHDSIVKPYIDQLLLLPDYIGNSEPEGELNCKENDQDRLKNGRVEFLGQSSSQEGEDCGSDLSKRRDEGDRGTVELAREELRDETHQDWVHWANYDSDERNDNGVPDETVGEPDGELYGIQASEDFIRDWDRHGSDSLREQTQSRGRCIRSSSLRPIG